MTQRIFSFLLALLMVAMSLTACGGTKIEKRDKSDESSSAESSESSVDSTTQEESSDYSAENSLTDADGDHSADVSLDNSQDTSDDAGELVDPDTDGFLDARYFNGVEINILSRYAGEEDYATYQVDANEDNYDSVISALYQRNKYIYETYGIDINVVYPSYGEDPVAMLRSDYLAGAGSYQAIVHPLAYLTPLVSDGLLADFNGMSNGYIRLEKDYWDQALIRDLSVNNRVYFLNGDAFLTDDEATYGIFFNKDLIDEYSLENPYDLVRSGEWTLDKMYEMLQQVDPTHGSYKSYDPMVGDRWGMVTQFYDFSLLMQGAGQRMVDNSADFPALRIDSAANVSMFNYITSWFSFGSDHVGVADYYGAWDSGVYEQELQIFANGNALFMPKSIGVVNDFEMRETEIHYGIVPMPKGSVAQENHYSGVNVYNCDVVAIPTTNYGETLDVTCYALEAMAYYGKALVTPEHYTKLAFRRFSDDDSVEMLDVIFNDRIYDMGTAYNFNGGNEYQGTLYFYTNLLSDRSDAIVPLYEQLQRSFEAGLDRLILECYN